MKTIYRFENLCARMPRFESRGKTLTQDQRSNPRPRNGKCNIGAFEGMVRQLFLPLILR